VNLRLNVTLQRLTSSCPKGRRCRGRGRCWRCRRERKEEGRRGKERCGRADEGEASRHHADWSRRRCYETQLASVSHLSMLSRGFQTDCQLRLPSGPILLVSCCFDVSFAANRFCYPPLTNPSSYPTAYSPSAYTDRSENPCHHRLLVTQFAIP